MTRTDKIKLTRSQKKELKDYRNRLVHPSPAISGEIEKILSKPVEIIYMDTDSNYHIILSGSCVDKLKADLDSLFTTQIGLAVDRKESDWICGLEEAFNGRFKYNQNKGIAWSVKQVVEVQKTKEIEGVLESAKKYALKADETIANVQKLVEAARKEAVEQERKQIASIMRVLSEWGQLNIKSFPLVSAMVEKLEKGQTLQEEVK